MKKLIKILLIVIGFIGIILFYFNLNTDPPEDLISSFLENYHKYSKQTKNHLSILIDYRKPVFKKRLWVIDNSSGEVWLNAHVGHAFKSGFFVPSKFSNTPQTELSSYGCFITQESYIGESGFSMKIMGLEQGINNNVRARNIIFHGYTPPIYSRGCFITWPSVNKEIIEMTKNGSLVLVYK